MQVAEMLSNRPKRLQKLGVFSQTHTHSSSACRQALTLAGLVVPFRVQLVLVLVVLVVTSATGPPLIPCLQLRLELLDLSLGTLGRHRLGLQQRFDLRRLGAVLPKTDADACKKFRQHAVRGFQKRAVSDCCRQKTERRHASAQKQVAGKLLLKRPAAPVSGEVVHAHLPGFRFGFRQHLFTERVIRGHAQEENQGDAPS